MYTFSSRIRYSEVDHRALLTPESLIDYFQDCSTFQSKDGGCGLEYLGERGLGWVINNWQIEINRFPSLYEEIVTGTIPYELKGCFGHRNFFMDTKDGERLAYANSLWTLMDFEKLYPARITEEIAKGYPLDPRLDMEYLPRKISPLKNITGTYTEPVTIDPHHLDTNEHVNNGQYIRIALQALPEKELLPSRIRAEYKKQARLNDILQPEVKTVTAEDGSLTYTVLLWDGKCSEIICIVEFLKR